MPISIGWDVGGWNCDRNPKSRDALVILNDKREVLGSPWRGNLRESINQSCTAADWVEAVFQLCDLDSAKYRQSAVVMAIDTPLGFPSAFTSLVVSGKTSERVSESASNPYLFRHTEQYLSQRGLSPLSPVKDMIGSQATKGMHVLARFAPDRTACGIWNSSDGRLTAIEAYPSGCKGSELMKGLISSYVEGVRYLTCEEQIVGSLGRSMERQPLMELLFGYGLKHTDHQDALVCALIAWLFHHQPKTLAQPFPEVPDSEGWIYVPLDALSN